MLEMNILSEKTAWNIRDFNVIIVIVFKALYTPYCFGLSKITTMAEMWCDIWL